MYGSGEETLYSLLTCLSETPLELVNNLSRRVAEVRADHFGHEGVAEVSGAGVCK